MINNVSQILPTKVEWLEISSNSRVRKLQLMVLQEVPHVSILHENKTLTISNLKKHHKENLQH